MSAPHPPPPPPPPPSAPAAHAAAAASSGSKPKSKWTVDMPASASEQEFDWKTVYQTHCAAQLGDASLLQAQIDSGFVKDLDAADDDGWAALHYAAWYDHAPALRVLLAAGAFVDAATPSGATALHFAAGAGRTEALKVLLEAGAQRDRQNEEKQTPAQLARQLKPEGWAEVVSLLEGYPEPQA